MNPVDAVLDWAERTPDRPAVVSADLVMTYAELADSVRRTAARLRGLGIRPGRVVATRVRPELEAVLLLALLHEGAVSMAGTPAVISAYGSEIDVLLGDRPHGLPAAASASPEVIDIDAAFLISLGAANSRIDTCPLPADAICRVVFSSGTTGSPKGVVFTVEILHARTAAARRNWMPADPFMSLLGLDTVSGFQTFCWSVFNGMTAFLPGDGPANLRILAAHGVRSIKTSPARLANLVDAAEAAGSSGSSPLPALEVVQVAGSLLTPALAERCRRVLGCDPVYLYGSTEIGTVTRGGFDPSRPQAVGRPVPEIDLEIVDGSGAAITTPGVVGAIRTRSAQTPAGYWHGSVSANAAFRDGWFYPGDQGSLDADGNLVISGRTDDVVNAGGAKFNLAELDLWLDGLDAVSDCASFLFTDSSGATAIGIAFTSRHPINPAELRARLADRLPNLEVGALIRLATIPRNDLGKVQRTLVEKMFGEQQR